MSFLKSNVVKLSLFFMKMKINVNTNGLFLLNLEGGYTHFGNHWSN